MAVKLVALDIDGTVIPPHGYGATHEPTERLTRAVRACVDSGIHVLLASGRMFPGTSQIARHFGLTTPVICQQGCSVHLPDGTMTHEFLIDRGLAIEICGYAREIERAYEWFNPLRYVVSARSRATEQYGIVSGIEPEYRRDPENSGVRPTGVGIISTHADANGIHRELVARHGHELHVLDFPEVTVAVAQDANKGHALSLVCDDLGIGRDQVIAIGDSVNDAAMLAWAGRGIAMPHSDAYAMDAADEVLAPGEDMLAAFLENLVRSAPAG
ncbi:HAD family hydrolase [Candidatus Amarobacter glycogenicus]|uniref:HAD family hydrolase n=1 Tax=Candidatus Amarobacter glycogenicus TaxID=3140699 RepID=UPI002A1493AB|nr:HAD family phosphatase [Dehalococcoidia bacterium]